VGRKVGRERQALRVDRKVWGKLEEWTGKWGSKLRKWIGKYGGAIYFTFC